MPEGSRNLAFIGNFEESPTRDTVFITEYSAHTAMEAVYTLLNVERAVPKVWGSISDICELLKTMYYLRDRKSLAGPSLRVKISITDFLRKKALGKLDGTWAEELLKRVRLI